MVENFSKGLRQGHGHVQPQLWLRTTGVCMFAFQKLFLESMIRRVKDKLKRLRSTVVVCMFVFQEIFSCFPGGHDE